MTKRHRNGKQSSVSKFRTSGIELLAFGQEIKVSLSVCDATKSAEHNSEIEPRNVMVRVLDLP